ncbi:type IV toxin-antitoxin system AbiEi family antitoxin domain-containing protein [Gaopeijia maritima]|uniref:Type IV toxin-antitoxin system AbiEi family antitoxin domain-containing protein n=1 Tax=Gaopeijia maritima TaxID=3119007 RepID=A0ABU9E950_9BACT
MPIDRSAAIAEIAKSQHGLVTRGQALSIGLASSSIARHVHSGRWARIGRGVYRVWPIGAPLEWAQAALLAAGPESALSHTSAAHLKGWSGRPVEIAEEPIHLMSVGSGPRPRPLLVVHRVTEFEPGDVERHEGIALTSSARTLIDLADRLPPTELERTVARALRAELLTMDEVGAAIDRYAGRRGVAALRALAELEGGPALTRSEAEARFLELLRGSGLPPPRANHRLGRWECDFLWSRERVVVEIDGFEFHSGPQRFERDRAKDNWLLSKGFLVLRFTWRQANDRPLPTVVALARTLARRSGGG